MRQSFTQEMLSSMSGGLDFDWINSPTRGRSGGILVGINKSSCCILEREIGDYFVRTLLCNKDQQTGKVKFLIELVNLIRKSQSPLILAGDFNMTRREGDKNKPGGYNKWSILFNSVISQGELMEIKMSGRQFTWSNNHEDPTYELLDRVIVSPTQEEKYPLVVVNALTRELSDHTPLLLSTGERSKTAPVFRFENCWLQRPDLKDIVAKTWEDNRKGKNNIDKWHIVLTALRRKQKSWNNNIEGVYKKSRTHLVDNIDRLDKLAESNTLSVTDDTYQTYL
jgi:hypothetical protein